MPSAKGLCISALNLLCDPNVRQDAGVAQDNSFLFANTEGSSDHVIGWDTVSYMCRLAEVQSKNVNATNNRGRVSTLYASLEVPPEERHVFYAHMGHSEPMNLGTYQRPLPIQEIVKVGQHLTTFDQHDQGE